MQKISLWLLSALLFLMPPIAVQGGLALAPLGAAVALIFAALALMNRIFAPEAHKLWLAILALLIWSGLTTFWAIDMRHSAVKTSMLASYLVLLYLAIHYIRNLSEDIRKQLFTFFLLGISMALTLAASIIITDGLVGLWFRQLISGDNAFDFSHLNKGAAFIATAMWVILYGLWHFRFPIMGLALYWFTTAILLSQLESLSAFLGFITASTVWLFTLFARKWAAPILAAGYIILFFAMPATMTQANPDTIRNNYAELPHSAVHRLYIWHFAATTAIQKPLAGWGIDASRAVPDARDIVITSNGILDQEWRNLPSHPHNSAIQLWLETGVMGLILFISALTMLTLRLRANPYFQAALTCYLTIGFLAFNLWQAWWVASAVIVMIIGYVVAASSARANAQNSSTETVSGRRSG